MSVEDESGALVTHALLISNTEQSRALVMRLFRQHPELLLLVHSQEEYERETDKLGEKSRVARLSKRIRSTIPKSGSARKPYTGESALHIAAVMKQEELLLQAGPPPPHPPPPSAPTPHLHPQPPPP